MQNPQKATTTDFPAIVLPVLLKMSFRDLLNMLAARYAPCR